MTKPTDSRRSFLDIDLSEGETIELTVSRSKIGLILIWIVAGLAAAVLIFALIFILTTDISTATVFSINSQSKHFIYIIIFALFGVIFVVAWIGTTVYKNNHLIITNKRAIQQITTSLFSRSTNVIDLQSIEDISFRQAGVFQHFFRLGTLRMSTVGDETTYTFPYIDTPRDEIKSITRLVHEAKTRPEVLQERSL